MRACLVLAHGKKRATCERHLPQWRAIAETVLFATPCDDPISLETKDMFQFTWGRSSLYDAHTNLRTREALRFALRLEWDQLVFCEYDAILWEWPKFHVEHNQIVASMFVNVDPTFVSPIYLHSPIIFGSKDALAKVVAVMDVLPDDAERGFGDRYIGLAAQFSGLEIVDGHARGISFSQNHIDERWVGQAVAARKRGALLMHGIKDDYVYRAIRDAI